MSLSLFFVEFLLQNSRFLLQGSVALGYLGADPISFYNLFMDFVQLFIMFYLNSSTVFFDGFSNFIVD